MNSMYDCAYVQAVCDRGPMEKPTAQVLYHEVEILREMFGVVTVIPTDPEVGGDPRREVRPAQEYDRLRRKYGTRPESNGNETWVEYVYGRNYRDPRFEAALEQSEAYQTELAPSEVLAELGTETVRPSAEQAVTAEDIEETMTKGEIADALRKAGRPADGRSRKSDLAAELVKVRVTQLAEGSVVERHAAA